MCLTPSPFAVTTTLNGASVERFTTQSLKMSGSQTLSSTTDLSEIDGFCPVLVFNGHMKRQAVAAEYNSGRNMAAWYRDSQFSERHGRELLTEARELELIGAPAPNPVLSEAIPTRTAAREYAKAEPILVGVANSASPQLSPTRSTTT